MNLTDNRLEQLDDPALTPDRRALLRCRFAAELIHTGKYEDARDALGGLWRGVGSRPELKGLSVATAAELLLQCGVLSGWLGSVRQIADAQEKAKDLLTESLRKFRSQGDRVKAAEVKCELGLCYFRLGAYDESRVVLKEAVEGLEDQDTQAKAKILIRRAFIEVWTGRYHDALGVLEEARSFFESCSDAIKGRWHGQMALALRRIATAENRIDYLDRAIIEYTAAAFHFEQAHNERYGAAAINNLAFLLYKLGRYSEAHEHLDRAMAVSTRLSDEGLLAQVSETQARVLVAEQRYKEANRTIGEVVKTFEKGGEYALLADALIIQGVVWSRLRLFDSSLYVLRRAMSIAQESGASSNAGLAALTLIEEHGEERLSESELHGVYRRADELLRETQDAEEIARLRACARMVIRRLAVSSMHLSGEDFSLYKAVSAYEAKFIETALELEGGSVTRAARRLGVSHQALALMLNKRHKNLSHMRTPPKSRRHSITRP